jgi:hypothetical protein
MTMDLEWTAEWAERVYLRHLFDQVLAGLLAEGLVEENPERQGEYQVAGFDWASYNARRGQAPAEGDPLAP